LAEKENLLFGYFYFTAEKVKSTFVRPLLNMSLICNNTISSSTRTKSTVHYNWLLSRHCAKWLFNYFGTIFCL